MAEVIGSVAAVAQLTVQLVETTQKLVRYTRKIANAPKEVTEFAFETDNLTGILDYFHEVAEKCLNGTSQETKGKKEKLIRNVKFQCGTVLKGVEDLRSRFSKLVRRDTKSFNWVERVRWLFDKPNVTELRLNIRFAMTFVSTLTSVLSLDESVSKGEANSLKVRMLKIKLQNSRVMIQTMRLEIEKHRQSHRVPDSSDISSPSFDILNETEDLQKQVENALHNYAKSQVTQRSTPVKQRGTSRPPGFVVPIPVPGRNSEQESRRQSDLEGNVEHHFHYPDGSVNVTKNGQADWPGWIEHKLYFPIPSQREDRAHRHAEQQFPERRDASSSPNTPDTKRVRRHPIQEIGRVSKDDQRRSKSQQTYRKSSRPSRRGQGTETSLSDPTLGYRDRPLSISQEWASLTSSKANRRVSKPEKAAPGQEDQSIQHQHRPPTHSEEKEPSPTLNPSLRTDGKLPAASQIESTKTCPRTCHTCGENYSSSDSKIGQRGSRPYGPMRPRTTEDGGSNLLQRSRSSSSRRSTELDAPSPWQPMPPFTKEDEGDRRRRRNRREDEEGEE